ncbi:MAG: hypothetical protein IJS01_00285 [Lentisphaeria bacterium]|nr:hypothetical protein [Lentisphaeria bacterium]
MAVKIPEKLSISFPIWALIDTAPGGRYADMERFVAEHAERGFNCIRFEDGAGLIHDKDGRLVRNVPIREPFTGYTGNIRQSWNFGRGGECDLFGRLVELLEAARKYDIYVILSSWYYLHTYWYFGDELRNLELHAIPPHRRFMFFAQELDRILSALRERGLIDRIAAAEVMNEADGLPFINGYGGVNGLAVETLRKFRDEHEQAISFLREKHPDVRFAGDTYTPYTDVDQMPRNIQMWNFHLYAVWDIYARVLEGDLLTPGVEIESSPAYRNAMRFRSPDAAKSLADIRRSRLGRLPAAEDWVRRIWLYSGLDREKTPELDKLLCETFDRNEALYREKLMEGLLHARNLRDRIVPGVPWAMAEGITYCGSNFITWEEHHPRYWEFLEYAVDCCRKVGLDGCVIRTCCGPEDPCWDVCKEKLLHLNRRFQGLE